MKKRDMLLGGPGLDGYAYNAVRGLRRFVWHLEGCERKLIEGCGRNRQHAFALLSRAERWLITLFCVRVEE